MAVRVVGKILRRLFLLAIVLGVLGFAIFATVIAPELRKKHEVPLGEYAATVAKHADAICADLQGVAAASMFPKTVGPRDAGPFLNPKIPWDATSEVAAAYAIPTTAPLSIPPLWKGRLDGWGKDGWVAGGRTMKAELALLDFDWMHQLREFDHWDLMVNSPAATYEQRHAAPWLKSPIPDYLTLQSWAKLRLLHGLASGDITGAVQETRHLAWLSWQSASVVGPAVGAAIIRMETKVFDATAPGSAARLGWTSTSAEDADRLLRFMKFSINYTPAAVPIPLAEKIRTCAPIIFPCSLDVEDASDLALLRNSLEAEIPEQYERSEKALASTHVPCAAAARAAWASPPMSMDNQIDLSRGARTHMVSMDYPVVRAYVGRVRLAESLGNSADIIDRLYATPTSPAAP